MLPSQKRLSRSDFNSLSSGFGVKTVFNQLGTLKYKESISSRVAIVISSKIEKRAVFRNKLRRRLYTEFRSYFNNCLDNNEYILYVSKQSPTFDYQKLKILLNELLKKTTK